ncbi:MAG: hypothetical protein KC505_07350 [Myxococcales bacterium]|nr:hypothetical protein [Myxococcales bacterium]USN50455.1 MAG: hypothetical protein H6731_09365 [Myxococcales bacterium]
MRVKNRIYFIVISIIFLLGCTWIGAQQMWNANLKPMGWENIKHVVYIIFENGNPKKAIEQPYFSELTQRGAYLSQFYGVTHPSQPNYIAMTAGSDFRIYTDFNVTIRTRHIGNLLEEAGKTWKVYAEDYPGDCFLQARKDLYVRKHVPFLSYKNVQTHKERCDNIVSSEQFKSDIANGQLPTYAMYVPNLDNDGHDTDLAHASNWLEETLGDVLSDEKILSDTLFVITFDEDDYFHFNKIYTVLLGAGVKPASTSNRYYNHYSMLRTIEEILGLPTLGRSDQWAKIISDIWN